jgi:site-specific DNA recombinase
MVDFALYEQRLDKSGSTSFHHSACRGRDLREMMRRMISLFDEYQSKENSKHTLRAMKENARRGLFNTSMTPFGYKNRRVWTLRLQGLGRRKKEKVCLFTIALFQKAGTTAGGMFPKERSLVFSNRP